MTVIKTVTIPERCLKKKYTGQRRVQFNKVTEGDLATKDDEESVFYVTRTSLENYVHNRDTKNEWMADAWTRCGEEPDEKDE